MARFNIFKAKKQDNDSNFDRPSSANLTVYDEPAPPARKPSVIRRVLTRKRKPKPPIVTRALDEELEEDPARYSDGTWQMVGNRGALSPETPHIPDEDSTLMEGMSRNVHVTHSDSEREASPPLVQRYQLHDPPMHQGSRTPSATAAPASRSKDGALDGPLPVPPPSSHRSGQQGRRNILPPRSRAQTHASSHGRTAPYSQRLGSIVSEAEPLPIVHREHTPPEDPSSILPRRAPTVKSHGVARTRTRQTQPSVRDRMDTATTPILPHPAPVHRTRTTPARSRTYASAHARHVSNPSLGGSTVAAKVVYTAENGIPVQVPTEFRDPDRRRDPSRVTYYIVPPGMRVIFRDKFGIELTRVGAFDGIEEDRRFVEAPISLQDHGRIIYATGEGHAYDPKEVVHLGEVVPERCWLGQPESTVTVLLDYRTRRSSHLGHHSSYSHDDYGHPRIPGEDIRKIRI